MKAMILAAGRGERMRPLTDATPKPLLRVAGRPLIEHHLIRLAAAGVREVVINVSHLGEQIVDYLADGSRWNLAIHWSREPEPLETAGGIVRALPLLGDGPFIVVNGDVWTDYPFSRLFDLRLGERLAHLVLVTSPPQHPEGDFLLGAGGRLTARPAHQSGLTYAGVGLFDPGLVAQQRPGVMRLRPLLDRAIGEGLVSGEHYNGDWEDVGTPQRLRQLDERARQATGSVHRP